MREKEEMADFSRLLHQSDKIVDLLGPKFYLSDITHFVNIFF